jgi:hypothetical protein
MAEILALAYAMDYSCISASGAQDVIHHSVLTKYSYGFKDQFVGA